MNFTLWDLITLITFGLSKPLSKYALSICTFCLTLSRLSLIKFSILSNLWIGMVSMVNLCPATTIEHVKNL